MLATGPRLVKRAVLVRWVVPLSLAPAALAQQLSIDWFTIDSGGAMFTTDGQPNGFELSGTIGQPDAGVAMTGAGFELVGGFWPGAALPSAPCFGDVDGDNQVSLTDLSIQLANFGLTSGATLEDGDLDGDGDVDLSDLSLMLSAFGTLCG